MRVSYILFITLTQRLFVLQLKLSKYSSLPSTLLREISRPGPALLLATEGFIWPARMHWILHTVRLIGRRAYKGVLPGHMPITPTLYILRDTRLLFFCTPPLPAFCASQATVQINAPHVHVNIIYSTADCTNMIYNIHYTHTVYCTFPHRPAKFRPHVHPGNPFGLVFPARGIFC